MFSVKSSFEIIHRILLEKSSFLQRNWNEELAAVFLFASSLAVNFYLLNSPLLSDSFNSRDSLKQLLTSFMIGPQGLRTKMKNLEQEKQEDEDPKTTDGERNSRHASGMYKKVNRRYLKIVDKEEGEGEEDRMTSKKKVILINQKDKNEDDNEGKLRERNPEDETIKEDDEASHSFPLIPDSSQDSLDHQRLHLFRKEGKKNQQGFLPKDTRSSYVKKKKRRTRPEEKGKQQSLLQKQSDQERREALAEREAVEIDEDVILHDLNDFPEHSYREVGLQENDNQEDEAMLTQEEEGDKNDPRRKRQLRIRSRVRQECHECLHSSSSPASYTSYSRNQGNEETLLREEKYMEGRRVQQEKPNFKTKSNKTEHEDEDEEEEESEQHGLENESEKVEEDLNEFSKKIPDGNQGMMMMQAGQQDYENDNKEVLCHAIQKEKKTRHDNHDEDKNVGLRNQVLCRRHYLLKRENDDLEEVQLKTSFASSFEQDEDHHHPRQYYNHPPPSLILLGKEDDSHKSRFLLLDFFSSRSTCRHEVIAYSPSGPSSGRSITGYQETRQGNLLNQCKKRSGKEQRLQNEKEEDCDDEIIEKKRRSSLFLTQHDMTNKESNMLYTSFLPNMIRNVRGLLRNLMNDCEGTSCPSYAVKGSLKVFMIGWTIQVSLNLLKGVRRGRSNSLLMTRKTSISDTSIISSSPSLLSHLVLNPSSLKFSFFLSSLVFVYRFSSCFLRRLTGREDDPWNEAMAGFSGGFVSMWTFYPSTQISLYTFWKTVFTLYWMMFGDKQHAQRTMDSIFYLSDSFLINCMVMEPHFVAKSYLGFIDSITGKTLTKFNVISHYLLTHRLQPERYGTQIPNLQVEHLSDKYLESAGSWLLEVNEKKE
jgi:hypothetical protein